MQHCRILNIDVTKYDGTATGASTPPILDWKIGCEQSPGRHQNWKI